MVSSATMFLTENPRKRAEAHKIPRISTQDLDAERIDDKGRDSMTPSPAIKKHNESYQARTKATRDSQEKQIVGRSSARSQNESPNHSPILSNDSS